MALPTGITPKTVTVGIASFFDGSLADGTVSITAPVNVVHTPTNNPVFSSVMTQKFVNGIAQFNLCPTDAPGLNRVDWTYVLRVTINGALVQPDPVWFTLPTAGPDTIDLDSLVTVPSSAGVPISATVVTSVNGQTGDVTVTGGTGGTAAPDATTTVKGIVKLAGDLGGTSALPTVPGLAGKAPTASPTFTGTVSGVSKAMVGLGSVDNTADTAKPVSTAQQAALNAKLDVTTAAATYVAKTDAIDLEATQDSIAGMFTGGTHSGISFSYNDPGNVINATVTPGAVADATSTTKGAVQLAGDLGGTASAPTVPGLANKVNSSTYTAGLAAKADTASLATVATSGAYADLTGKPAIPAGSGTAMAKAISGINCYGDSLTEGGTGGNWPTRLAALIPVSVINYGVSGQYSSEVALRQGGLEVLVTITGGQIPASGSVAATVLQPSSNWRAGNGWSFVGSLAGIPGSLAHDASANWTFTRTSPGSAVPVSPEMRFVSDQRPQPGYGCVIWAGRNNISSPNPANDIKAMAAQANRIGNPYIVLPILNGSGDPSGSANYTAIMAANAAFATDPNFYDLRGYMIRNGLADAGITPTAADTTAIAEDRIPASLMNDALHPNAAGWTVIANRLARLMISRDWFTTTVAYPAPTTTPAVANTVAPAITGTATTGSTLTVSNGTWSVTPDSYTYQWKRAGSAISGATAAAYVLVVADEGQAVTCTVTAVKAGYTSGSTTSNTVTPTSGATPALTNSTVPTITGTPTEGQTLTASTGTWSATPDSYTYVWKRAGAAISGATASTYLLVTADVGSAITVTVTAIKAGYTNGTATSAATASVAAAPPSTLTNTVAPAITGTVQVGSTLTTSNGTWTPTPDSYTYVWNRSGTPISGATAATYVLVSADLGATITSTVTAVKASYSNVSATSAATGAVVAAPTGGLTDTFNRADSTTGIGTPSDGGAAWVTADTWGIASNNLYQVGAAANAYAVRPIGSTSTSAYVEAVIGSTTTTKTALALGRFNGTSQYEGYAVLLGLSNNTDMQLWKVTAGNSWQAVTTKFTTGLSVPYVVGDTIRVEFVAGTIKAYRNGTQIATGADATYANVTQAGVIVNAANSAMRWDSIALGTF